MTDFDRRREGDYVEEGGTVTNTDLSSYYDIRRGNVIVTIKIGKTDDFIRVTATEELKNGTVKFTEWSSFNKKYRRRYPRVRSKN